MQPPADDRAIIERVGRRLQEARQRRGLTQEELATRCALPQTRISEYETAKVTPSVVTLYRLALALGVRVGDLVDDPREGEPWSADLATRLEQVPETRRARVRAVVQALLDDE